MSAFNSRHLTHTWTNVSRMIDAEYQSKDGRGINDLLINDPLIAVNRPAKSVSVILSKSVTPEQAVIDSQLAGITIDVHGNFIQSEGE